MSVIVSLISKVVGWNGAHDHVWNFLASETNMTLSSEIDIKSQIQPFQEENALDICFYVFVEKVSSMHLLASLTLSIYLSYCLPHI